MCDVLIEAEGLF